MKKRPVIYLVGGAVRDKLLELPVIERDWVVVGADEQWMLEQGFIPADPLFPVFLHPQTREEYALARTESKAGEGYRGFIINATPDITLEQDLARRDLTINAMAEDAEGRIIDPYGGRADLDQGLLRHVTPAFVEDPLRLLRIARFSARLGCWGFHVAHATHKLMKKMSASYESIPKERLWREMAKAMKDEQPWRFFEVLNKCHALAELMPEISAAMGEVDGHGHAVSESVHAMQRIASTSSNTQLRLAVLLISVFSEQCTPSVSSPSCSSLISSWCDKYCAERSYKETALRLAQCITCLPGIFAGDVEDLCNLLKTVRVEQDHTRLNEFTLAVAAIHPEKAQWLEKILHLATPAWSSVSGASLKAEGYTGAELGNELALRRKKAVSEAIQSV